MVDALNENYASDPNGPQLYFADPNSPDDYAATPAPDGRSFDEQRFCESENLAYLNGGLPPVNLDVGNMQPPTNLLTGAGVFNVLAIFEFAADFSDIFFAWKIGLFHPTASGFTVMKDAAQNVLSTVPEAGNGMDWTTGPANGTNITLTGPTNGTSTGGTNATLTNATLIGGNMTNPLVNTTAINSTAPAIYIIVPRSTASISAKEQFQEELINEVGASNVRNISDQDAGPVLWKALLTPKQAQLLERSMLVQAVTANQPIAIDPLEESNGTTAATPGTTTGSNATKRAASIKERDTILPGRLNVQENAPPDLAVVSRNPDAKFRGSEANFYSQRTGGQGITVYVVDSGANIQHPEYTGMAGQTSWLTSSAQPLPGEGPIDKDPDDKTGHGSCVLSLVAGPTYGVAKNVDVVLVKLPYRQTAHGVVTNTWDLTNAIMEIKEDIKQHNLAGQAVINISQGVERFGSSTKDVAPLRAQIRRIVNTLNVPVVVSAGNDAPGTTDLSHYPALFAKDIDGVIAVGATDNYGRLAVFSQGQPGGTVKVWAPAVTSTVRAI
jgi:Subtilase family